MRTNELCANDVTLAVSPSHFGVLVFGSCFFDAGDVEQKMRSESSGRFSTPKAVTAQGALYSLPTTLGALESWLCNKSRTFVRSQCSLRGSGVDDNGRQFGKINELLQLTNLGQTQEFINEFANSSSPLQ